MALTIVRVALLECSSAQDPAGELGLRADRRRGDCSQQDADPGRSDDPVAPGVWARAAGSQPHDRAGENEEVCSRSAAQPTHLAPVCSGTVRRAASAPIRVHHQVRRGAERYPPLVVGLSHLAVATEAGASVSSTWTMRTAKTTSASCCLPAQRQRHVCTLVARRCSTRRCSLRRRPGRQARSTRTRTRSSASMSTTARRRSHRWVRKSATASRCRPWASRSCRTSRSASRSLAAAR